MVRFLLVWSTCRWRQVPLIWIQIAGWWSWQVEILDTIWEVITYCTHKAGKIRIDRIDVTRPITSLSVTAWASDDTLVKWAERPNTMTLKIVHRPTKISTNSSVLQSQMNRKGRMTYRKLWAEWDAAGMLSWWIIWLLRDPISRAPGLTYREK